MFLNVKKKKRVFAHLCAYASNKPASTPVIRLQGGRNKTPNYYYRDVD